MQDVELYRQLLGLNTPWTVTRIELKVKGERVEVWAGHAESARWPCPGCATELPVYDHAEERTWRHMNVAVDRVRRQEHRLLRAQGDDTLTGSKYVWLYGEENVPDHHQARFTKGGSPGNG